jgi:hypothetical protein
MQAPPTVRDFERIAELAGDRRSAEFDEGCVRAVTKLEQLRIDSASLTRWRLVDCSCSARERRGLLAEMTCRPPS